METKQRKSAVDLTDLAVGLVILGVVVSIGAIILINVRDSRLTSLPLVYTGNETITASNSTGSTLTNTWFSNIVRVYNATDGATLSSTNYTNLSVDSSGIAKIVFPNPCYYCGSSVNVSYQWYNTSQADYKLANNASLGIGEFGSWFKILVIVGIAAVVLSLIFMAFGRGNQNSTSY